MRGNMRGKGPGRGAHSLGVPVEKPRHFKETLLRLVSYLKPMKSRLFVVSLSAVFSTIFTLIGPITLGKATTRLFEGFMMKMKGAPNAGIDFAYIYKILLILALIYLASA